MKETDATRQAYSGKIDPANDQPIGHQEAELLLLRACQAQSFPEEVAALKLQKLVPLYSRLSSLVPEWDSTHSVICVGGKLRRLQDPSLMEIHPVVLDRRHPVTKLLIMEFDERLFHPGAEIRRQYWILQGRQAITHHQLNCSTCQQWRAQPKVLQMADLPPEDLRLLRPPFYSTGIDCFGPSWVKICRRNEKRWGVCMWQVSL